jgi:hypothetical protein
MKRRLILAGMLLVVALGVSPLPAAAQAATVLTGGGTATQCQWALQVALPGDGSATGHFDLLMAGRLALYLPDGTELSLLHMQGQITSGSVNANGTVTFTGAGTQLIKVEQSNISQTVAVRFTTTAVPGGAGVGRFTAVLVFPPPMGGVTLNEDVVTGMITLH